MLLRMVWQKSIIYLLYSSCLILFLPKCNENGAKVLTFGIYCVFLHQNNGCINRSVGTGGNIANLFLLYFGKTFVILSTKQNEENYCCSLGNV